METNKSRTKLPKDLKSSIGLLAAVSVYVISAACFPDSSVFVNSSLAAIAAVFAIFTA